MHAWRISPFDQPRAGNRLSPCSSGRRPAGRRGHRDAEKTSGRHIPVRAAPAVSTSRDRAPPPITQIPSASVSCQNERSQHRTATPQCACEARLRLKLKSSRRGWRSPGEEEIGFGSPIRSYVLAAYQMIRTTARGGSRRCDRVMKRTDLDPFTQAVLDAESTGTLVAAAPARKNS